MPRGNRQNDFQYLVSVGKMVLDAAILETDMNNDLDTNSVLIDFQLRYNVKVSLDKRYPNIPMQDKDRTTLQQQGSHILTTLQRSDGYKDGGFEDRIKFLKGTWTRYLIL